MNIKKKFAAEAIRTTRPHWTARSPSGGPGGKLATILPPTFTWSWGQRSPARSWRWNRTPMSRAS